MNQSIALSTVGFFSTLAGVCLLWGVGWMLIAGGLVLFVVGGLLAREGR